MDTRIVSIGNQDFENLIVNNDFYIDKTHFIKEWWENRDPVTLITRPRRFGKTLLMSMVEKFFSLDCREKSSLFEKLSIFKEEAYRKLQGTYPVIFLSFASVKEIKFEDFYEQIKLLIAELYQKYAYLLESEFLNKTEKIHFTKIIEGTAERALIIKSLYHLSAYLSRFHGKKPIILLDEYDTPMQEAYLSGYWDEMTVFIRGLFNSTFKTNPYMERALLTGITRVSKESVFSDLNNLVVVTTTTKKYEDSFGFTEEEVFHALEERGLGDQREAVKQWYDGFTFGSLRDVYNPWSITNFLDQMEFRPYWANTSSNGLISRFLQSANKEIKEKLEFLLQGHSITELLDEQIVFNQLDKKKGALWSLMLASGYLKAESANLSEDIYTLAVTNQEVRQMLKGTIRGWFQESDHYGEFLTALLSCDTKAMNTYLNRVLLQIASFFDGGKSVGKTEPERFYHGLVLGLIAELEGKYHIRSNREIGFGRYDVMMEPADQSGTAYILEFKVLDPDEEKTLEETADAGLKQIKEKQYSKELVSRGFHPENIRHYAFAFEDKKVLVKEGQTAYTKIDKNGKTSLLT